MENEIKTYSIDVALAQGSVDTIDAAIPQDIPTARKLGGVATNLLRELAGGGFMLSPGDMQRISKAASPEVLTPEGIVKAVEKAYGRDGDHLRGVWKIDPALEPYFRDLAGSSGRPVEALVQDNLDLIFVQLLAGWMRTDLVHQMFFTEGSKRKLAEMMGVEQFCGEDLVQYIESLTAAPVME